MIDILISDVSSRGNQVTTRFVMMYPACAVWHPVRKRRDLFLGNDCCGLLSCQKHTGGRPQGQWSGKQARQLGFTDSLFHSGGPDLLAWKGTVLQPCLSRGRGWKTVLKLNCGLFRPSPGLNQLFSYSERIPEFPLWTDILPLTAAGRLGGSV